MVSPSKATIRSPTSTPPASAGTPRHDVADEQSVVLRSAGLLSRRQLNGERADAKKTLTGSAFGLDSGSSSPCKARRDHDGRAADGHRRDDAKRLSRGVDQSAAGQRAVRWLLNADDPFEAARTPGPKRSTNDADRRQRRHDVAAPRPANRDGETPDFGFGRGWQWPTPESFSVDDGEAHVRDAPQDNRVDGWRITGVNRDALVVCRRGREDKALGEHHARSGAPVTLNLYDRARGLLDGGRNLIRKAGPCVVHASTVDVRVARRISRMGGENRKGTGPMWPPCPCMNRVRPC